MKVGALKKGHFDNEMATQLLTGRPEINLDYPESTN